MDNFILFLSIIIILIPIVLYVLDRKLYYYALIIVYPIIGQLITVKIELFTFSINPSMLFGFLILTITAIDFILGPSKDIILEVTVLAFIFYSLITCVFSPNRFESLSWTLKVATWLLILLSAIKLFKEEKDLMQIQLTVCVAVLIVILSFFLSWLGLYGEGFIYETGVVSYGAGFSSGKTLAYHVVWSSL